MRSALVDISGAYTSPVSEQDHVRNIRALADQVSVCCGHFLANGRVRFGVAQKELNLFLKYLWCADRLLAPPHCPFDAVVIGTLPNEVRVAWTKIETEGPYLRLVEAAKVKAEGESLAKWELRVWNSTRSS